jgi:hypothetical protein
MILRLLAALVGIGGIAATAMTGTMPAAAEFQCPKSYTLWRTEDTDPVFWGKDANGNGWVCVNANGPGIKAVVVIDDK